MSGALELALRNLTAWSLQVGALALAAAAAQRLLPIDRPAARLALGQMLLVSVLGLPLVQPWHAAAGGDVAWSLTLAAPGPSPSAASAAPPSGATTWPVAVAALLLLGLALHFARLGAGLVRLRSLCRAARPLDTPAWLGALRDELAPRARLLLSEGTGTPATCGLLRPVVLLPPAFQAMARERQESIALHELIHARRGDWPALMLEELLKALLYFHPAVHWLVGRVRLAREQAVDAAVVERLGAREAYLHSLVEVALSAARARAVPAAPFLHHSHLRERVDLLLRGVSMSRVRTLAHIGLTGAALVLVASWAVVAAPLQSPSSAAPAAPTARPATVEPITHRPAPLSQSVHIADEVQSPGATRVVHRVPPAYPPEAKAEKVEGVFVIDVRIGKDGAVREARVVASAPTAERLEELKAKRGTPAGLEGDPRLAEAAVAAVKQWRYEPVLKNGEPVDFEATVTVNFRLS